MKNQTITDSMDNTQRRSPESLNAEWLTKKLRENASGARHHANCAIATVGPVSLTSGKVAPASWHNWKLIWECWEENRGTNLLLLNSAGMLKIVHTSADNCTAYRLGDTLGLYNDQTHKPIGNATWRVIGIASHSVAGLLNLAKIAGTSRVVMATFK